MGRLKTELAKLKQSTGVDDESADVLRLLIDLVGRRDGLFWPRRTPIKTHNDALENLPAIMERRQAYLDGSVGIAARASGAGDWKRSHYLRRQLIDLGYATACSSKGQVTSLIVAELGDTIAQAAIYGDVVFPFRTLLHFELLQRKPGLVFLDGPWRSESKLFGLELVGNPHKWVHLTDTMLPLLVRGLVRSHQDTMGRIFYGFVSADLPEPITVTQPQLDWAHDHYIGSFNGEITALDSLVYDGHELVIPLPATSAGNCLCSDQEGPTFEHGELAAMLKIQVANPLLSFEQSLATAKEELKNHAENP